MECRTSGYWHTSRNRPANSKNSTNLSECTVSVPRKISWQRTASTDNRVEREMMGDAVTGITETGLAYSFHELVVGHEVMHVLFSATEFQLARQNSDNERRTATTLQPADHRFAYSSSCCIIFIYRNIHSGTNKAASLEFAAELWRILLSNLNRF